MKKLLTIMLGVTVMFGINGVPARGAEAGIEFVPISHASFVILAGNKAIYVDPTRDIKNYEKLQPPDIILVTHTHGDHFNKELIGALKKPATAVIGPKAVIEKLSYGEVLNNGGSRMLGNINVEAVPAYNTTPERARNHPKGEGNGYIVTIAGKRIYISGDTEDTPDMRVIRNIDYAFVCMNLPYTMSVEQAALGVLDIRPKVVFPYHYREGLGFADVNKFKQLIAKDKNIEVRMLEWYK